MDHCPTNQLDRANLLHIGDRADHGLDAHSGQPAELPDQLARPGAVFAYVETESASLLDGVVVAALGLAILAQDRQLLRNLRPGAQRTGVRVARHQPQRLLRAFAGDEDRRVRAAQTLRQIERAIETEVLALEGALVATLAAPHAQADLQRLVEPVEPLRQRRKRDAQPQRFFLVVTAADAEPHPPA